MNIEKQLDLLEEWLNSGLEVNDFAKSKNIPRATFFRWIRKFNLKDLDAKTTLKSRIEKLEAENKKLKDFIFKTMVDECF